MSACPLPTLEQTSALIRHRRTVKPVDMDPARPVERALLAELIENATWAPTHGLTQPWRFFVFQGKARERLAAALASVYEGTTPVDQFREDKLRKLRESPLQAPVVLACAMERRGGDKIPELEEIEAVAAALQNLMLTATAAGLGSFWSTPPVLQTAEWRAWLQLGPEDRCLGLIYLGWPKPGHLWPRSQREAMGNRTTWTDA